MIGIQWWGCILSVTIAVFWLIKLKNIFLLLICIIFAIIGAFFYFIRYGMQKRLELLKEFEFLVKNHRFSKESPSFLNDINWFKNNLIYAEKHSITGFSNIDAIIEQIMTYIIQDFVDSWYKNISPNSLFQESLKRTARRTLAAFSYCVKKVDWTPLLTRHFVDDFASHLRLYRKAKEKLQLQKENLLKTEDLETLFFDLELEMEKSYCRDLVSTSPLYESAYLHDIVDILLYLLMPLEDFRSSPLRFLIREIIVSKVLVSVLDKFSDPIYVNYLIVWLLSGVSVGTDDFITCLETCESVQELESILESVHEEINSLKSKDCDVGMDHGDSFKQQLASLDFTVKLIKKRMVLLANKPEVVIIKQLQINKEVVDETNSSDFVHLPITVVLTHQTAISYFIVFLTEIDCQRYIDFYLSVEGFKVSVEHQLKGLSKGEAVDSDAYETIKEAALFMYRQYLSQEAITRVPLDESIINKFLARLRNDEPFDSWFEQLQKNVVDILENDERFYSTFKKHPLYLQMLKDLGILKAHENDEDSEELNGEEEKAELISLSSDSTEAKNAKFFDGSCENISDDQKSLSKSIGSVNNQLQTTLENSEELVNEFVQLSSKVSKNLIKAETKVVVETLGVGQQKKHMFALYNVRVSKTDATGRSASSWNVIRRYSDFHALNSAISYKFPNLRNLNFPGKKTFNNLDQSFLEKRCKALNIYMTRILEPSLLESIPELKSEIYNFLTEKVYKPGKLKIFNVAKPETKISKKMVSAMFDPILSGVKAFGTAVTAVPDQVFDGIGKVGSEINKTAAQILKSGSNVVGNMSINNNNTNTLNNKNNCKNISSVESNRVAAHLFENDSSNAENIPLRFLLLFVDEVFGLRGRNQWFRRRLVALLRQFINATLESSINKRIIDAVQWLTSNEQVAQYLAALRDSIWSEKKVTKLNLMSEALRTRFLARCLMLSALPDELRLFIGASTTINGVNNIFEALQNRHLNRRFWYVIFERLLSTIFPNNRFEKVLPILHSKSPRTRMN